MTSKMFLIDLDGTLYRGSVPIPNARSLIHFLRDQGIAHLFTTNCPQYSPARIAQNLNRMGIPARPEQILSPAVCMGSYLKKRNLESAFVVGSSYLSACLAQAGIQIDHETPQCVVVGHTERVNYAKIRQACIHLQRNPVLISANPDHSIPYKDSIVPHTGALVAYIQAVCPVEAECVGKPERYMLDYIIRQTGCSVKNLCIIGDNPVTDIAWGNRFGIETYLVNNHGPDPAEPERRPTRRFEDLAELLLFLRGECGEALPSGA